MNAAGRPSRLVAVMAAVGALAVVVGVVLGLTGGQVGHRSTGADAFSRSAIGHRGAVELLRRLEIPVSLNMGDARQARARGQLLVIAEPLLDGEGDPHVAIWDSLYAHFYTIVVVLPKWEGTPSPQQPAWLGDVRLRPSSQVESVLTALKIPARVGRLAAGQIPRWQMVASTALPPHLPQPQLLQPLPADSLTTERLTPLWSATEGVLAAYWRPDPEVDETIVVIADPDLIANHGLGRGGNALHFAALMDSLDAPGKGVVFDETLHGYRQEGAAWRALLRFPLSLILLNAVVTAGFAVWLAAGRFGAVVPPPTRPEAGLHYLIANTADLLHDGKHAARALHRYHDQALADTARRLHLDGRLTDAARQRRLIEIGQARGVVTDLAALEARVLDGVAGLRQTDHQTLELANAIHRWRREMTHGL